ncbi:hypothetical protein QBC33DRAFT_560846 [Phialemonium atrogriseum]|uniref:MARVEL domain-containing protein n=1 Tax=Phialemonium atrogriseum TaxID=1093897 RepID=A0AAJ0BWE1_9PEZI|nr:uncharacterized protein QBC33DRAFT_560846 [Phialemonium atrogriseum]KAK1765481.1 hypothetical protein QBC33DRAFT_560846 [Phialemonium atrogriseum]
MATQFVAGTPASPFLKRVLIPFWVVRILIMVVDLGLYGLSIGVVAAYKDDIDDEVGNTGSTSAALAILVVIELLILTCLVLDIVCIVKRARRTLSPRFFLIVNVIQTLFWTIMFIMGIISTRNGLNVGIGVLLFLSFLGLLIYASVMYHRHRKGTLKGAYVPANPGPQYQGFVQSTGYQPTDYQPTEYQSPAYQQTAYQPTAYQPTSYQPYPTNTYTEQPQQKPVYYDPQSVQAAPAGSYEMDNRGGHYA